MWRFTVFAILLLPFSGIAQSGIKTVEIHGHRGFRGRFPENTVTAFVAAAKLGAAAIEMDVVISADSQVVVSHEPWFNHRICSEPDGTPVTRENQHNLYQLDYAKIRTYDCGKRGNPKFPGQAATAEHKPLLSEVIDAVESCCRNNHLPPVQYNIEIKCGRSGDNKWHPPPQTMVRLLCAVLKKYSINGRILIQSFDMRSLRIIHALDPSLRTGLLSANIRSVRHNIRRLGYTPYMYNPYKRLANRGVIRRAHKKGMKVIVWTISSEKEMKRCIRRGADGLITDYPDIAIKLRDQPAGN